MSPNEFVLPDREANPLIQDAGQAHHGPPHWLDHWDTLGDVTARLEWLDDLMFAAIDGDPMSLESAAEAWKMALNDLGAQAVEESRRQYLRRAQSVWDALRHQPNHPPHKVFAAIEVISLLAGRAW